MASNVTSITTHLKCETEQALDVLIEGCRDGVVPGVVLAYRTLDGKIKIEITGVYKEDPGAAIGMIGHLYDVLSQNVRDKGGRY